MDRGKLRGHARVFGARDRRLRGKFCDRAAAHTVRIDVRAALACWIALTASTARADSLAQLRCYASAREHGLACPAWEVVGGVRDAGYLLLFVRYFDDAPHALGDAVVTVGAGYAGTIALVDPIGEAEVRRRFARGGFVPTPIARRTAIGAAIPGAPHARLYVKDAAQLDAAVEVDCGGGRIERDVRAATGQTYYTLAIGGAIVVFGRLVNGDQLDVGAIVVVPAEVCAR